MHSKGTSNVNTAFDARSPTRIVIRLLVLLINHTVTVIVNSFVEQLSSCLYTCYLKDMLELMFRFQEYR